MRLGYATYLAREVMDRAARDGTDVGEALGQALLDIHETSYEQGVNDTLRSLIGRMGHICGDLIREREAAKLRSATHALADTIPAPAETRDGGEK